MRLRHGLNPHQHPATVEPVDPARPPLRVVYGEPSYLNVLDAAAGWALVREAATALGRPAAASIKHLSPAGAATAGPVDAVMTATFHAGPAPDTVTSAYLRARDADPKSSYGDVVAVSAPVDAELADLLRHLVSDGIVAPGFEPGVVATLAAKKKGRYLIVEADPTVAPPATETREVHGLRLTQPADTTPLTRALLRDPSLPAAAVDDLLLGLVVVRHTQSNSVAYVRGGMTLGVGAGQQSRVDCTRLAGAKADLWWQRRGVPPSAVACVSDGALPFADNVEEAAKHGVRYLAEPGGSIRSAEVAAACRAHGITLVQTGMRLFRH